MTRAWAAAALLFCGALLAQPPPPPAEAERPSAPLPLPLPPPGVLAHLARGVNLSNWFQQAESVEPERYVLDEVDWLRIRSLRLRHVRVLIDPAYVLGPRGLPRPEAIAELRSMIDAAAAQDLLVAVALQLPPELKQQLATSETARVALAGIWRTLATALRDYPVERLIFEPLNESELADAAGSRKLQEFLVQELRAVVPSHTLVVSGHHYADATALSELEPLPDRNLVYAFHFYEPYNFTHQGATWGAPAWAKLRWFPYPSSPKAVAAIESPADTDSRELLRTYGRERWGRDRIRIEVDKAAQWGKSHGVPVWCAEFGAMKLYAKPEHRRAWLRDVRDELEAHGIGWTHWDYAGDFGIVSGPHGQREPDALSLEALGLPGAPPLNMDSQLKAVPAGK